MTTISINYNIKDLFGKDKWEKIEEKYSCAICQELIYNQKWYQCNEGHTACHKCWSRIISDDGSKECHSCRTPIKSLTDGLSRCLTIENNFKNKKICCPNIYTYGNSTKLEHDIENGCKEVIKIEQLETHQKNCNNRFVECNNHGCNNVLRYQIYLEHEKQCEHAIIQCELCNFETKRSSLINHQDTTCPSKKITCNHCPKEIKRCDLKNHIDTECPNIIIECELKKYGCNEEIKRSELSKHLEQVNHTIYMLKLIDEQSQQIKESKNKYNDLLNKIDSLLNNDIHNQSQQIDKQSQQIKESNNKYDDLLNKINNLSNLNNDIHNQSQQIDKQSQQIKESNNKYDGLLNIINHLSNLNNDISYCNTWIITNFIEKTGPNKPFFYSPQINIPPYRFLLETSYNKNKNRQYYYLFVKGEKEGKVNCKFSFELLNCKDPQNNKKFELENEFNINKQGYGAPITIDQYSVESGYIFPDGSVQIKFTINIEKQSIQS